MLDVGWAHRLYPQTVWIMLGWLVLCMTGLVGPIGNAAHVAGLLVGMAAAAAPIYLRRLTREMRR
jgi:GlpG protein